MNPHFPKMVSKFFPFHHSSLIIQDVPPWSPKAKDAEGVGFEPTDPLPGQRFSRPPRSTTPAPLRSRRSWKKSWSNFEEASNIIPDFTAIV